MTENEFCSELAKINIIISEENLKKFNEYYQLLVDWNDKFNLTSIIDKKDVFLKHFYDSVYISKVVSLDDSISLCDFGTGAGFPGLPLKILFDNIELTLVESNAKKCEFLSEIISKLNLKKVNISNKRMEHFSRNNREMFDIITCRAVSNLKIITELAMPALKIDGKFIPLKANIGDELDESRKTIELTGGSFNRIIEYSLPIINAKRTIIIINKIKKTSTNYPRNYSIIKKETVNKIKKY